MVMGEIIKLDNICQYNEMVGQETLHPLVSVLDLSKSSRMMKHVRMSYGFYAVFLKEVKCGDLRYGRNYYDYQEGTLVFLAPGQVIGIDDNGEYFQPKGRALLFHPDLIRGTSLGRNMKDYSFFSYEVNEALHLSEQERGVIIDCLNNINEELNRGIDKHSKMLIVSNIELLLNYSIRFYDRQFITREKGYPFQVRECRERLLPDRQTGNDRFAVRTLLRRPAASFRQLFRRPDKEGNG